MPRQSSRSMRHNNDWTPLLTHHSPFPPPRVSERAEENKMTASNLGIIFGPTLVKPRQADAEVSLSSLVDYPYQALIVELLVRHYQMIFDTPLSPLPGGGTGVEGGVGGGGLGLSQPRLTPQQLSRHSKSLGDIKEVCFTIVITLLRICCIWPRYIFTINTRNTEH